MKCSRSLLPFILLMFSSAHLMAGEIRVAVANNFAEPMKALAQQFQIVTGHRAVLIFGSTGKHYAQIINGAPFDLFFAADSARPERLENEGYTLAGTRFTYAIGKIVLWSADNDMVSAGIDTLNQKNFRYLAIANPKLAPYGLAAQEVLQNTGLWNKLKTKMVRGENISQTFQFVKSGNAALGFIAYAQIHRPNQPATGSWWKVPENLYSPIEQQAVLLKDSQTAQDFLAFMHSETALAIIHQYAYDTP